MPYGRGISSYAKSLMLRACLYRLTWVGVPFFGLYALFIQDKGISAGQFSLLLMIASVAGFVLEVPSGVLADRWDRRHVLHLSSVLFFSMFVFWLLVPNFWGFAVGFALWGAAASFWSGTLNALLYDNLNRRDLAQEYAKVRAYSETLMAVAAGVGLLLASPLFTLGGYRLVGAVTLVVALVHIGTVFLLPHSRASDGAGDSAGDSDSADNLSGSPAPDTDADAKPDTPAAELTPGSYFATLRAGVNQVAHTAVLRTLILAFMACATVLGVEEYLPRLWNGQGLSTAQVPISIAVLAAMAGLGNAVAARASRFNSWVCAGMAGSTVATLGIGALISNFWGVGLTVLGFGLGLCLITALDIRMQDVIAEQTRATVGSITGLSDAIGSLVCFAVIGGLATFITLAQATMWLMVGMAPVMIALYWHAVRLAVQVAPQATAQHQEVAMTHGAAMVATVAQPPHNPIAPEPPQATPDPPQ